MTKYQPYSRRVWRRLFGTWVRSNLGLIVGITTGVIVLIAAETVVFTVILTPNAFTWAAWAVPGDRRRGVSAHVARGVPCQRSRSDLAPPRGLG